MKSDYQNTIIDKVRVLRLSHHYSQRDVSAILNISSGQIGNIESPTKSHKYTLAQLSVLCDAFGVNITDLFLDNTVDLTQEEVVRKLIDNIIEYGR